MILSSMRKYCSYILSLFIILLFSFINNNTFSSARWSTFLANWFPPTGTSGSRHQRENLFSRQNQLGDLGSLLDQLAVQCKEYMDFIMHFLNTWNEFIFVFVISATNIHALNLIYLPFWEISGNSEGLQGRPLHCRTRHHQHITIISLHMLGQKGQPSRLWDMSHDLPLYIDGEGYIRLIRYCIFRTLCTVTKLFSALLVGTNRQFHRFLF